MATKLKNLKVTKVDFVDEGANPRADIKLYKRKNGAKVFDDDEETDEMKKNLSETLAKTVKNVIQNMFQKKRETLEDIEKGGATSFKEKINEVSKEKIREEIWSVCYALNQSLCSIVSDGDLDASEMLDMLNESVEDFYSQIRSYVPFWAAGESSGIRKNMDIEDDCEMQVAVMAKGNLEKLIKKAKEGELEDMLKIDKSKMTPEEREAYEEIVKKYAVESEEDQKKKKPPVKPEDNEEEIEEEEEDTKKGKRSCKKSFSSDPEGNEGETDDIYKGIHPAVRKEIEELRKFRENAENRELTDIAKKYEVIGKKPEELVPTLKSLKAAGGTAYDDMIATLDSMVDVMKQSGVFGEIGKSRSGDPSASREEAFAKARVQAAEIRKSRPEISMAQAMDEVLLANPELLAELDK